MVWKCTHKMQIQDADNKSDPPVLEVRAPTNAKLYVPVVVNRHKVICSSCYFIVTI